MFASQVLRLLQTIPADVNHETRVFDISAVKLTMKEDQNAIYPSNDFEKNADKIDDVKGSLNAPVPDCSEDVDKNTDGDKEVTDFQKLGDLQGAPLCDSNRHNRGSESLIVNDQSWTSPEIEHSIIIDSFTDLSGKGAAGDSETLCTPVSQLFEIDSQNNFYTDKAVRECELPEITVCYKENNFNIIKDICVDEGLPTQDKTLIETEKDDHAGLFVSKPCGGDEHNGTAKGCHGMHSSRDGVEALTVEQMNTSVFNEDGTKGVDVATYLDGSKSSIEDDAIEDGLKVHSARNLEQMSEANLSTTERTENDAAEDEPAISSRNSSQELTAQDAHLHSSDDTKVEAPQENDEVPSVEAILESIAVAFNSGDPEKTLAESNLQYNRKVEGGIITFDFNSSNPSPASNKDEGAENLHEESQLQSNGKLRNLDDSSGATLPQRASNAEKNGNVDEPKPFSHNAADSSIQIHRDVGESSFSSAGPVSGLITYSGPIAFSGSISLRSDSSTTSTRSFAFPVLQSEWNSSPVRMVKAERRHFRKHRGWRQGLFCCRF